MNKRPMGTDGYGKIMSERRIYFDYNATAPLRRGARVAMTAALHLNGNASSVHREGRRARAVVERARQSVASLLNAAPAEVVFTSGGTEANNWVLNGQWDIIFVTGVEHESVLAPVAASGAQVVKIPVDGNGVIKLQALAALFERYCPPTATAAADADSTAANAAPSRRRPVLLSLQMANNETGVVQPVAAAAQLARARGIFVHTDAVQALGRLPLLFSQAKAGGGAGSHQAVPGEATVSGAAIVPGEAIVPGADFMTLSSHKLGGPQGVGALLIRQGFELPRLLHGGGQERRRRAGTENVAAIAGFGSAAEAAARDLTAMARLQVLRDELEREILAAPGKAVIIGSGTGRLANTSCIALPGLAAETLVIKLDLQGFAVSAGSACSSGKVGASHVLAAMGVADDLARSAIRISLGWGTTRDDIDSFLDCWPGLLAGNRGGRGKAHAVA